MRMSLLLLVLLFLTPLSSYSDDNTASNESAVAAQEPEGSYSLWLMPEGEVLDKFSQLIIKISSEYNSPRFKPHVTLLGDLTGLTKEEFLSKASRLAQSIEPFTITLKTVQYPASYPDDHEAYYRSLYIVAERTEALMKTNESARKIFDREGGRPYNPHLSIIYGPFSTQTKEEIISKVGREFNVSFEVSNIYAWSDKGLPHEWKFVKEIPLGRN